MTPSILLCVKGAAASYAMLCYTMLHYAMLHYVMLHYVRLFFIMLHYVMFYCIMTCCNTCLFFNVMLHHLILSDDKLCDVI